MSKHSPSGERHECCVVDTAQQHRERVLAWTREGLAADERVLLVQPPAKAAAFVGLLETNGIDYRGHADRGQLLVIPPAEAYLVRGEFDPARRLEEHAAFVEKSVDEGWAAVRMSAEATVALAAIPDRDGLRTYEHGLEELTRSLPLSALCFYSRNLFAAALPDAVAAHPAAVSDRLLRVGTETGRMRAMGEADASNADLLNGMGRMAVGTDGNITVDLSALTFIDVGGVRRLVDLARSLPPGRRMRVVSPPHAFRTIVDMVGWSGELDISSTFEAA
jgi:anti-anti-sigma regulatory factor